MVMYDTLESVTVLWHPRNYCDIILIIIITDSLMTCHDGVCVVLIDNVAKGLLQSGVLLD